VFGEGREEGRGAGGGEGGLEGGRGGDGQFRAAVDSLKVC
jgi:hypothetical protein